MNPLGDLGNHLEALLEEVRGWVEARLSLFALETEDFVNQLIRILILVFVVSVFLFFCLITLALGLGMWLGHAFWGFLLVTALLLMAGLLFGIIRPKFMKIKPEKAFWNKIPGVTFLLPAKEVPPPNIPVASETPTFLPKPATKK
ncbi:MAG: phage holin family protein [Bacteroidetes Order II. Incertae sedis bacterium]|nr:phage holin family protein [Bacteroidetes Order II. bacterium]